MKGVKYILNFKKNQVINFTSRLSDFETINPEFTRCKCYAFASGDNANGSDITMEAIDKAIARGEFFNKPIVAHLYYDENDNSWRVGGHDSKWVITNTSIEIINECIPFGTIPESANIRKEEVLEPDGITVNTYVIMDIILWTGRYNIMDAAYSDDIYFNQSCEISINEYHYKENDVLSIDDFTFSALCLLNKSLNSEKNVRPCFPSCRVERIKPFSLNESKFKQNFELMLQTLKQYEVIDNDDSSTKGEVKMDKSKIIAKFSEFTYKNVLGEDTAKYVLIDITDTSVGVIDREDNKSYSFNWTENEGDVVVDFDNKKECVMTYRDFAEGEVDVFDYAKEIGFASDVASKLKETQVAKSFAEEYTTKINDITATYTQLKAEYDAATAELEKYRQADAERLKAEKHAQIDTLLETYSKKIGRLPEFLCYRASVDYSKDFDDIQRDLTIMAGKAMMDKNKGRDTSYNPTSCGVAFSLGDSKVNKYAQEDRYGDLLDRVMNK